MEGSGHTEGISAGVSLLSADGLHVKWSAISGELRGQMGTELLRNESPSAACLDGRELLLLARPERVYPGLGAVGSIAELLMIPFGMNTDTPGTLWLAAHGTTLFHGGTAQLLKQLADHGATLYHCVCIREQLAQRLSRKADQQSILDQLPVGIAKLDQEYRYTYLNDRAVALLKIAPEVLLGNSVWDMYPEVAGTFVEDAYRTTMDARTVTRMELFFAPVQNWFDVEAHPASDGGIVVFFHDVQERKQRESELELIENTADRERRFYNTILTTTPDFAYIWGADYTFLYGNKALLDLYGLQPEEYIGRSFRDVGYPEWHARMHEQEIDEVVRTGQPLRGKIPFRSKGGGGIYDYIFMPVFGPDGKVEAIAGTTRDVTELERAAEALKEADKRKDEFLAVLAHELRNPLAPLRSGVELLADGPDQELVEQARRIMARQVEHMVHMVDDLMDLSRVNRGAIDLRKEPMAVQDVLEAAVETVRPLMEKHRHGLEVKVPPVPVMLHGDRTRLAQIFSNLLNNAAKYTPPGGRISLTMEATTDQVMVTITDNGAGIQKSDLAKVFEMFAQVSRTTDRAQGGLGIGLNIVQRLTRMHGGSITVASEGLGMGSAFTVTLPISSSGGTIATEPRVGTAGKTVKPMRILIVDDNVDGAFALSMLLKKLDHEVHAMHSGEEALGLVKDFKPDVVFLDIGMPGMDGYEVCRRMRELEGLEKSHIVALTGWGQQEDKDRAKEAGFDQHLVKPINRQTIMQSLEDFAKSRS